MVVEPCPMSLVPQSTFTLPSSFILRIACEVVGVTVLLTEHVTARPRRRFGPTAQPARSADSQPIRFAVVSSNPA
jgi:hypothetical protein